MKNLNNLVEKESVQTSQADSTSRSRYGIRHLSPGSLSPLKKQLNKQLADLKGVNNQQRFAEGPFEYRSGSRYIHSIIVSND